MLEAFEAGAFTLWVTDDCVFVSTIPTIVKVDDQRRLHCESGPAFVWLEDIEDYYWRGANVPKSWIDDKESIDPKTALTWPNIEQRRAAIEIIGGWGKVLDLVPNKVIDRSEPATGTLIEATLPDIPEPELFLRVTCGTGREFGFCVPKTFVKGGETIPVKTALDAQRAIRPWITDSTQFTMPEVRT